MTVTVSASGGVCGFVCSNTQSNLLWSLSAFKGQTDKGIKIGSTKAEVIAAYGQPDEESDNSGTVQLFHAGLSMDVVLVGDRVEQMGLLPTRPGRAAVGSTASTRSSDSQG